MKCHDGLFRRREILKAGAAGLMLPLLARAAAEPVSSEADGDVYQVSVKLKTPKRGTDKRTSRPLDEVSCSVFVPRGVKTLGGATFNPFYEPTVGQGHWRAAAGLWDFAHIGSNFFRVHNEELGPTLLAALKRLAEASGHPELEHLPLCIHGMSIGGGLTSRLVEALPQRTIAAAPVCLEVGPRDEASGRVPMITIFGERDGRQMEQLEQKLPSARATGAQWAIAPQWGQRHEWHRASNMVMPFYNRVIAFRNLKGTGELRPYSEKDGWLGDRATWRSPSPRVAPFSRFEADPKQACWLPDAYVAAVWRSFVSHKPPIRIASPAGMGDEGGFRTHPAQRPIEVKIAVDQGQEIKDIRLFDGDRLLGKADGEQRVTLEGLKPGVYALIAEAKHSDGQTIVSAPNTILVTEQPTK